MRKKLSEIFLDELHNDYSDKSVLAALIKCDDILKKDLEGKELELSPVNYLKYFFVEDKDTFVYNDKAQELFDFWDVFQEFHEIFERMDVNPDIIILRTMLEIEYLNTQLELDSLRKGLSETFQKTICEMTDFIVELKDKKTMMTTVLNPGNDWRTTEYPLDTFRDDREYEANVIEHALLKEAGKIVLIEIVFESGEKVSLGMKEDGWKFIKEIGDL